MTDHEKHTIPAPQPEPKHRFDELLDEPCANPRYGDLTVREAFIRVLRPIKTDSEAADQPDSGLQFEL